MERTLVSEKELRRVAVIARANAGELTSEEAGELLCLSARQVKRLRRRFSSGGERSMVHGNSGRRSNRAKPESERGRVLELVREHYGGSMGRGPGQCFGPTLAAEHLLEDHGLSVAVSSLRRWMREAGLWSRARKRRPHRSRRERKAHFGEMVQLDGSFHDWLEGRCPEAPTWCLMTMTDDATSNEHGLFAPSESFWAAVAVLRSYVRSYGVPRSLYTDWKTLYHAGAGSSHPGEPQFARICHKLNIELIPASSPQAKGRVERSHGTNQDRLVKKLRAKKISSYTAASEYLESYFEAHNARFRKQPASGADYHLPLDLRLDTRDLWCWEERRRVSSDSVISYKRRKLLLTLRRDMPANAGVLVRESEDGALRVIYRNIRGREYELRWRDFVAPPALPRPPLSQGWSVRSRPRPDHPWRVLINADARVHMQLKQQTPGG